mgnify:CR=1 FL=1
MTLEKQNVKLVDGTFTPVQASDVISSLIDKKINFHKVENLQNWERDHSADPQPIIDRIKELEAAKKEAKAFIKAMKNSGKNIKIEGELKISIVE